MHDSREQCDFKCLLSSDVNWIEISSLWFFTCRYTEGWYHFHLISFHLHIILNWNSLPAAELSHAVLLEACIDQALVHFLLSHSARFRIRTFRITTANDQVPWSMIQLISTAGNLSSIYLFTPLHTKVYQPTTILSIKCLLSTMAVSHGSSIKTYSLLIRILSSSKYACRCVQVTKKTLGSFKTSLRLRWSLQSPARGYDF